MAVSQAYPRYAMGINMTKRDLKFLLTDIGLLSTKKITEDEASAKDQETIYHEYEEIYEWEESELTHEDIVEALLAKQTQDIRSIKNICTFFAVVLCISLLLAFLGLLT